MAFFWGPWKGHLIVGRDSVVRSTTQPEATVTFYVGTDGWSYADNQRLTYGGDISGYTDFYNDLDAGSHATSDHQARVSDYKKIASKKVTGSPGEEVTVSATLSGSYLSGETPSYSITFKLADKPSKPSTPTVTGVGQSSATVNMVLPGSNYSPITATRFRLYTSASGGTPVASHTSSTNATSRVFSGLSPNTTYYAEVDAVNGIGTSVASGRKSFTTKALVAPDKPADPVVSAIGDTTATITLTAPATHGSPITGYTVKVFRVGSNTPVYEATSLSTSRTVTVLTIGTNYRTLYRAESAAGPSEWSEEVLFSTQATVPGLPQSLALAPVGTGAEFSWSPPSSDGGAAISQYGVEVYSDAGYSTLVFSEAAAASPHLAEPGGLPLDQQLWWRVRAQNVVGWGEYAAGTPFTLASDGGIYYVGDDESVERARMYWVNPDGVPVLMM